MLKINQSCYFLQKQNPLIKQILLIFTFLIVSILPSSNLLNAQILLGSKYRYSIVSPHSKMALDVPYGSSEPNTSIIQWNNTKSNNQKWYFTKAGNGRYRIHSANNYLVLDIKDQILIDSAAIVQNYASLSQSQMFNIESVGTNAFTIKASHSNKVLSIKNESLQANAAIIQMDYNAANSQKWQLNLVDSISETFNLFNPGICTGIGNQYRIHARSDVHLTWDVYGASTKAGGKIDLWEGQGQTNHRCYFEAVGSQKYLIYMMHTGQVVQPEKNSTAEGTGIVQMPKNSSLAQQFSFLPLDDGYYAILNANSGLALTKKGKDIVQSTYTGDIEQHWKLIMTEGNCNGVETGVTAIQKYYTKTPTNTCNTIRMFYVVPSDAPKTDRKALCAAAALSQQRTWAKYGYTVVFQPIVKVNSTHDMNWFMTNGDNAWYSYGQNAEAEVKLSYPIDYSKERLLLFVEGVCSAAAGGGGSASIPGCMIDGMANGEPNNYGVVGHELGHHIFGTVHPKECEKTFPQDNMCNNVYPANIIYSGSYTDSFINGNEINWIAEKGNCIAGTKLCDLPKPLASYKIGNKDWIDAVSPAKIGVQMGQSLSLSMSPHNLSYYRWYGPNGLLMRGDKSGNILVSDAITDKQLGMYRCVGINDEGCSIDIDIIVSNSTMTNTTEHETALIFQVRPNPATSKIMIDIENWEQNTISFTMFNHIGQVVKTIDASNMPSSTFELNISDLTSGLYYILVEDKSGNKSSQKFIKI